MNRERPETQAEQLFVLSDGRAASTLCVSNLLHRVRHRVGLAVHAHRFRHTFATRYLTPYDSASLTELGPVHPRVPGRGREIATPFEWKLTRSDLDRLLSRLAARPEAA